MGFSPLACALFRLSSCFFFLFFSFAVVSFSFLKGLIMMGPSTYITMDGLFDLIVLIRTDADSFRSEMNLAEEARLATSTTVFRPSWEAHELDDLDSGGLTVDHHHGNVGGGGVGGRERDG